MSQRARFDRGDARDRTHLSQTGGARAATMSGARSSQTASGAGPRAGASGSALGDGAEASASPSASLRTWLLAVAALALLVGLSLSGSGDADAGVEEPALERPLPSAWPSCRLRGEAALARAKGMEALADASWERLPFALEEAPKAVIYMAEAESCYRAGFDREGRQRAEAKRNTYEAELSRRWARAQLGLELARRRGALSDVRSEIARLLALSSRAGPEGDPYRRWLERMDRVAQARVAESKAKEKED
jgi:hypothetical protein